jgi:bifunctional UDP-N-acetylglucosamine pyrophosphorylase/glucosamine-1-phosphate N-acetyltransferase
MADSTVGRDMGEALAIVLAAGKGTRMKSSRPKVLHEIAGRSMLGHVVATVSGAGIADVAVVVSDGEDGARVATDAQTWNPACRTAIQRTQRGTGDAVLAAKSAFPQVPATVFVLFGDTPLVQSETLGRMRGALDEGAHVVVLSFEAADPTGYGRVLTDDAGAVVAIREHKDATPDERNVRLCNSGVMAFRVPDLWGLIERIGSENASGEMYLTDAVELARADGLRVSTVTCPESEVMGVNNRVQLAEASAIFQARKRTEAMLAGVTMVAPETVWLSFDTEIGNDVVIEPNVVFGPGVRIAANATIRANCHLEGADVASGAVVGPFARLRPGARLGEDVRIGNFVEVKNTVMGAGAKANHLSYLGDGSVGAGANIGAGTIFCNYDGFNKHKTVVGEGAFVGSNSALVAPVTIADGAFIASGSVIVDDVPADALAVARGRQAIREGWAIRFREEAARLKAERRR